MKYVPAARVCRMGLGVTLLGARPPDPRAISRYVARWLSPPWYRVPFYPLQDQPNFSNDRNPVGHWSGFFPH